MSYDDDGGYEQRLGGYVDVAERIVEFRNAFAQGCLRPQNPDRPIEVITIGDRTFLQYVACAYRTPDDTTPGIGIAWEEFPGRTPYTRNSEAMNAETSAWGRAIVAVLAADSRRGIASQQEIRNRQAEREQGSPAIGSGQAPADTPQPTPDDVLALLSRASNKSELAAAWVAAARLNLIDAVVPGEAGDTFRTLWLKQKANVEGLGQTPVPDGEKPAVAPTEELPYEVVRFPNGTVDQVETLRNKVAWLKTQKAAHVTEATAEATAGELAEAEEALEVEEATQTLENQLDAKPVEDSTA